MNKSIYNISKCLLVTALTGLSLTVSAQNNRELKGRVLDADNQPVAGAVVNVAEDNKIVLTDANGDFTLKNVRVDDEVCVAALGFETAIVTVDWNKEFVVNLASSIQEGDKMMPIAFSTKKQKYMTESRAVVSGEELQRYPITVLQNAFSSTLPGVETYEWSSEPGWTETAMFIRGLRTMNKYARQPLIIVDNVERDLSFLDAFPIDNITVLKDAAATAIYGMRGANGAILVTTKRGEKGKTKIDFTQEVGFQTLTNHMENQNAYNMALTQNRVKYLSGQDPIWTDEQIAEYKFLAEGGQYADDDIRKYKYFDTNWFDRVYRKSAPVIKSNLQISGGNDIARYYVSFSYLRQDGMWNKEATSANENFDTNHHLNRYNLRTNLDINVNKYLNVSLDLGGRIDNISQSLTSVFDLTTFGAIEADPTAPLWNPNGTPYSTGAYSGSARNPIQQHRSGGRNKNRRRNLYSTLTVTGDLGAITKGLKTNMIISFDAFDQFMSQQTNTYDSYTYNYKDITSLDDVEYTRTNTYVELTNPTASERVNKYNLNFNFGFSYDRDFGKHHVDARAFVRAYRNRVNTEESENHAPAALSSNRYLSWNGYANYVFDNRYILNGSISRMGNDNYAPEDRWDTFWGVGAGWILSNEKLFQRYKGLDLLKLRASYGKSGQCDTYAVGTGRYPYQSTFGAGTGYGFGTNATWVNGMVETLAGNMNNKWEISRMLNIGADWSIANGRFYGSFDWFKEWRSQILIDRNTIPTGIGISVAQDSYGKVESRGFEAILGHKNRIGDFKYNIEASLSWNTNKITEMDELEPNVEWQRKTGKPIFDQATVRQLYEQPFNANYMVGGWNQYQFVQWASDPSKIATSWEDAQANPDKYPYNTASGGNQPLGTAVFKDLNGDRKIDSNDQMPLGYTIIPELTPSLSLSAEFKGFDLKVIATAYLHRSVFVSPAVSFSGWSNMSTHEGQYFWGYFTDDPTDPRNVNAKYPRPVWGGYNAIDSDRGEGYTPGDGTYQNDIWIMNGDYLSLRNVEFGYSLPARLIAKARMTKCRLYVSGYNLMNWSHLPGDMDPEKPMGYCWWYPKTRIFNVGVNISF